MPVAETSGNDLIATVLAPLAREDTACLTILKPRQPTVRSSPTGYSPSRACKIDHRSGLAGARVIPFLYFRQSMIGHVSRSLTLARPSPLRLMSSSRLDAWG